MQWAVRPIDTSRRCESDAKWCRTGDLPELLLETRALAVDLAAQLRDLERAPVELDRGSALRARRRRWTRELQLQPPRERLRRDEVAYAQRVVTPAGTFTALVVTSSLEQAGFPFGSGTRTCWFAPGVGLVKLVFRHGDGSVSTVVRTK